MILRILVLWAPLGLGVDQRWQAALEASDYVRAWSLVEEEPEEVERLRARAAILYRAGDPVGSLAAAEAGLRLRADHLELLHHAAASSIWLEDGVSAQEYSSRLLRIVESERTSQMLPADRESWLVSARRFVDLGRELESNAEGRHTAVERARGIALGGLGAAVLLAAWTARRYGRSSKPVS